ncbi:MAG: TipAS antibiotic-recognition domain-containing protein [Firmicutes bacterium]|nr:TipAS antibiotic-recognition domain-containing protein [Bacillota bacterium]
MSDKEKFRVFENGVLNPQIDKYEGEAREKYGDEAVEYTKKQIINAYGEDKEIIKDLTAKLNKTLKLACEEGVPSGEIAQKACELHKEWISYFWKTYSKEAHLGLCEMYTKDQRFYDYFEKIAPKAADMLYEAMKIYLK